MKESELKELQIKERYSTESGGYAGRSMSNRAVSAYMGGEKPYSVWTKADIIEAVCDINEDVDISALTLAEMKETFLTYSSWHHTGRYYQRTSFYALNEDRAEKMTQDDVDSIIRSRKRNVRTEEQREAERRNSELIMITKDILAKLYLIYASGDTGLKTLDGVIRRWIHGTMDLEAAYADAIEAIRAKDRAKVDQWRTLPDGNRRHEDIRLYDTDIEAYALRNYRIEVKANTKEYKAVKSALERDMAKKSCAE